MKTLILLLSLCGGVLAYSFSGGYHPVPHFTPHFSEPIHVSPHFSPSPHFESPHVSPSMPHYSAPVEVHPYFSPTHPQAFWNPMHPYYWLWHHNSNSVQQSSGSGWGTPEENRHGWPAWKIILTVMAGILLVMTIVWGLSKALAV